MVTPGEARGIWVFSMNSLRPAHPGTEPEVHESQGLLFNLMPVRLRLVHLLIAVTERCQPQTS